MSGEEIRKLAQQGDHKVLRSLLLQSGNPCSVDEYQITPLMYAAWNGHIECVKYLACNTRGINKDGIKCNALNMVTSRGYTGILSQNLLVKFQ